MNIRQVKNSNIEIRSNISKTNKKESSGLQQKDSVSIGKGSSPEKDTGLIKLNILHMNDVHGTVDPIMDREISQDSKVGGLAYSAVVVDQEREKNPEGTLTLNAGDLAEGTMAAYVTKGRIVSEAMRKIGFDAVALGNHDFEWGQEALGTIVGDLDAPVVAANVVKTSDGSVIDFAKPYVIKEIKGVKVGIIGLDTRETERYIEKEKLEGLKFENEIETAKKYVPEVKEQGADLVLVLSHLGFNADRELAKEVDGIDVIVGGHSHTALREGHTEGNTIIVQAGSQSRYVGNLELNIDPKTKKIKNHEAKLVPVITNDLKPDNEVLDILEPYLMEVDLKGDQIVGKALEDLQHGHKNCCKLNEVFADSIREASGAEIGLVSSRILRGNLPEGDVKYKDLYSAMPFTSEKFFTAKTTGKRVLEEIESRIVNGGRGISVPSGFTYEYDPSLPEGQRVVSTKLPDGSSIDPKKEYSVVLNSSTVTREAFKDAKEVTEKGYCQQTFFETFEKGYTWDNKSDQRVQVVRHEGFSV